MEERFLTFTIDKSTNLDTWGITGVYHYPHLEVAALVELDGHNIQGERSNVVLILGDVTFLKNFIPPRAL